MDGRSIESTVTSTSGGAPALCFPMHLLLQAAGILHVDFLSLDVESFEFEVLSSHDFSAVPIDTILIETLARDEPKGINALKRWALSQNNFCRFEVSVGAFEIMNEVWLHRDFVQTSSSRPPVDQSETVQ
jgi:hypothetical protein